MTNNNNNNKCPLATLSSPLEKETNFNVFTCCYTFEEDILKQTQYLFLLLTPFYVWNLRSCWPKLVQGFAKALRIMFNVSVSWSIKLVHTQFFYLFILKNESIYEIVLMGTIWYLSTWTLSVHSNRFPIFNYASTNNFVTLSHRR